MRLLDDEKFASLYAEDKRERSGWGSDRIQQALLDRGIEYGLATTAASACAGDEIERALGVLGERDYDLEEPADRQKALGVLARRGYQAEVAYDAIRRARRTRSPEPSASRQDRSSGAAPTR